MSAGCPGSAGVPLLDALAGERPILGQGLDLQFTSLPLTPSNPVLAIFGFSATVWPPLTLPVPLAAIGMPGCTGYVSLDLSFVLASQNGVCNWTIQIPNNPALTGLQFYVQGLVLDIGVNPAGLVASNAGAALVGTH